MADGKKNGKGTHKKLKTDPNDPRDFVCYIGNLKDDKREGYGKCEYTDGSKYEGEWRDDEREGEGKYYDKDGMLIQEGIWE